MKAQTALKEEKVNIRIIDLFCVKPFDKETVLSSAKASGNKILVVEDHYKEGGLYETVCSGLGEETDVKVYSVAVNAIPRSGSSKVLY